MPAPEANLAGGRDSQVEVELDPARERMALPGYNCPSLALGHSCGEFRVVFVTDECEKRKTMMMSLGAVQLGAIEVAEGGCRGRREGALLCAPQRTSAY
jgi:hypothetical protein